MDNPADDWDLYLDIRERYQPSGGMMDEFINWATENVALHRRYEALDLRTKNGEFISQDARELYAAWVESARRADKRAREECCNILSNLLIPVEKADYPLQIANRTILEAIKLINDEK